jgi:MarR family transcriptional regulator, organic hydroperoxide resistance regulator
MFIVEQNQGHVLTTKPDTNLPWDLPRFRNWIAVAKVNQLVEKAMTSGLAPLDLKLPHFDILANVYRFPGLSQQELADRLLVGRSNLSMLLPELEKRNLLARKPDPADMRIRRLTLTSAGQLLTEQGMAMQLSLIEHMMEALNEDECNAVGEYMRRIGAHMMKAASKD